MLKEAVIWWTKKIIAVGLHCQFGFVVVLAISALVLTLHKFYQLFSFRSFMKRLGLSIKSHGLRGVVVKLHHFSSDSEIGIVWFTKQMHLTILLVSIVTLMISYERAVHNRNAVEFARGGALVVIEGLISLIVGLREARHLKSAWSNVVSATSDIAPAEQQDVRELMSVPIDRAQSSATWLSVLISAVGTFVWGYGDQILACGVFPAFLHITDKSGVSCF